MASTSTVTIADPLFRLDVRENWPTSNGCEEPSTSRRIQRELRAAKQANLDSNLLVRKLALIKRCSIAEVLLAVLSLQVLCVLREACDPVARPSNAPGSATIVLSVALLTALFVAPLGFVAAAAEVRWALALHACCSFCMSITLFVLMGIAFNDVGLSVSRWDSFDPASRAWYPKGISSAQSDLKGTMDWAGSFALFEALLLLLSSLTSAIATSKLPGGCSCVRIES